MKKLNLLFILFLTAGFAGAQNYLVTDSQGKDITNTTHTIFGGSTVIEEGWDVKNLNNDTVNLMLKRYEVSVVAGTKNYFCFGDCFDPIDAGKKPYLEAFEPIAIAPNDVETSTYVYLRPEGNKGSNEFLYVYYDSENPDDSVYVELTFDVADWVGIDEVASVNPEMTAGPIPATDFVNINYSFNNVSNGTASIAIIDLLGKEHAVVNLEDENGTIKVNTSDLKAGIYFYALRINENTISTKKLVVN